jgi:hypothetical protein
MTDKLNKSKTNMDISRSRETENTLTNLQCFLMGRGADHPHASRAGMRMGWSHTPSHFCARTRMS